MALRRLWVPLSMAALAGIGISYRLLFVLKAHTESLLMTGVAVIVLIPWTWALFLYATSFSIRRSTLDASFVALSGTKTIL